MTMFILTLLFCSAVNSLTYPGYENHYCKRKCNGTPMTCRYNFTAEQWYTMNPDCKNCLNGTDSDCSGDNCITGDGSQRLLSVINRRFPGPSIHVCKGDKIIVTLRNNHIDYGTSIHWHGQYVEKFPFMDGVRMVTQCPIPLKTTFKYVFHAGPAGTYFYHAHVGVQKADGVIGALIVREPTSEKNPLYDYDLYEHTITIAEMDLYSGAQTLLRYYILKMSGGMTVSTITINGFAANTTNKMPPEVFVVKKGFRYRFRTIQAGPAYCITKFHIEKHNLSVISTDGNDMESVTVESINLMSGERFDFVLHADQTPGYYWVVITGEGSCQDKTGLALLKYEGAIQNKPENSKGSLALSRNGVSMNCIDAAVSTKNCYYYYQLKSKTKISNALKGTPTFKYYLAHDMVRNAIPRYRGEQDENIYYGVFNKINYRGASTNMLEGLVDHTFCNSTNRKNCDDSGYCSCTHVIQIPYKAMVEFIIVDEGSEHNESHAIHLHGHGFYVVAQERLSDKPITVDYVKSLDAAGKLKRNLDSPAFKDTLSTPNKGYAIIRFVANNEGYWFYHCHLDVHVQLGFSLVVKVGNPAPPPKDFPKCGDYLREDY